MSQRSKLRFFAGATPTERRAADLFLADLLGRPAAGPRAASSPEALPRRPTGPASAAARREADLFLADLLGLPAARRPAWLPLEHQPPAPAPVPAVQVERVGTCSVLRGGAVVPIWPLPPGTSIAAATPAAGATPAPAFGIVDLLIRPSADPLVVAQAAATPAPAVPIAPAVTSNTMALVRGADGSIRISFAVPTGTAAAFVGTLRLAVRRGVTAPGTATQVDLPIRVAAGVRVADLAMFLVPHASVSRRYCWTKLKVIRQGDPTRAIAGAAVEAKALRDNLTLRSPNRKMALVTDAGGFAALAGRNVIAYPIDWPLIFDVSEPGAVVRGHLVRLRAADIHDNGTPHEPAAVPMTRTPDARLTGRRIMLDAGHGVVSRRSADRRSGSSRTGSASGSPRSCRTFTASPRPTSSTPGPPGSA